MARAAKAEFLITADDRTKATFDKASNRINALGRQASRAALGVAAVGAAMTAATVKAIGHADAVAKNAKAAGVASGAYQELDYTFSQFGISSEKTSSSLERFTKRIGEAAAGSGQAAQEYERLGISLKDSNGEIRPSEEILRDVSAAFQGMTTEAERSASAADLFGREGVRLKDALAGGPEQLDRYAAEARKMGVVLDADLLRNAEAAGDELDKMRRIATAQATVFASSLFPAVISVGNAFAAAAPHVAKFFEMFDEGGEERLFGKLGQAEARIREIREQLENNARSPLPILEGLPSGRPRELTENARAELEQELSSMQAVAEAIKKTIRETRKAAKVDEEGLAGGALDLPGGEGGSIPTIGDPEANVERAQAMFDRLHEQRLQAEQQTVELEQIRRDRQLEKLEQERIRLEEAGLLTQEMEAEFRAARWNAELAAETRITELKESEAKKQAAVEERLADNRAQAAERGKNAVVGALNTLASQSKAAQVAMLAFEKGKAIADVITLTQVAAARAMAELGPVLGPPAAAAIKAAGAASVGLIASQSVQQAQGGGSGAGGGFGGSGSLSGGGDSRPTPSLPNPAESVRERDQNAASGRIELVVRGEGDGVVRAFADELQRSIDDGDAVFISRDSRQAMEIRGD
mgnify:CR=1 FL=1